MARYTPDVPEMKRDIPLLPPPPSYHGHNELYDNKHPTTVKALASSSKDVIVNAKTVKGNSDRLKIKYNLKLENAEKRLNDAHEQTRKWANTRLVLVWAMFVWLIMATFSGTEGMLSWMIGHHLCGVLVQKEVVRVHDLYQWDNTLKNFFVFKSRSFKDEHTSNGFFVAVFLVDLLSVNPKITTPHGKLEQQRTE